jgi:hypothetical protein
LHRKKNEVMDMKSSYTNSLMLIGALCGVSGTAFGQTNTAYGPDAFLSGGGNYETAIGAFTLWQDVNGHGNTAIGYTSMYWNTTGGFNTGIGLQSLNQIRTGFGNTASGANALIANTTGGNNTAAGLDALACMQTGNSNTASGAFALGGGTFDFVEPFPQCPAGFMTGNFNTASGAYALSSNTTGNDNTASGSDALFANTTGASNTADGYYALYSNTNGASNTASGHHSLYANTTGYHNTAAGADALESNVTGDSNTAFGLESLFSNTSGSSNIAVGEGAGYNLTTGSNDIDIGNQGVAGESGTIRIGTSGAHTAAYVAGINTARVTGSAVYVTSTGQLGVLASSERYKTAIEPMGGNTARLRQLRPVSFTLRNDPQHTVQYGLIAEQVARVYPELVIRDDAGNIQGVRYEELAPMLLNELQKQQARTAGEIRELRQQVKELQNLAQLQR